MSRSKSEEERLFYLQLCVHDRLSTRQLDRQIDSALYERNAVGSPKLSAVLREIAPQAEQIFRDQYVMEFIGGKEFEHKNSMKAALVKQMKKFILELGKDFLFYDEERHEKMKKLDEALDKINREYGTETVVLASQQYTKKEGKGKADVFADAIRHDFKSPCYTTRWSDIPEAT